MKAECSIKMGGMGKTGMIGSSSAATCSWYETCYEPHQSLPDQGRVETNEEFDVIEWPTLLAHQQDEFLNGKIAFSSFEDSGLGQWPQDEFLGGKIAFSGCGDSGIGQWPTLLTQQQDEEIIEQQQQQLVLSHQSLPDQENLFLVQYYYQPIIGYQFRSKKDVLYILEFGTKQKSQKENSDYATESLGSSRSSE